jgi:quinol monooxygenase YgiN
MVNRRGILVGVGVAGVLAAAGQAQGQTQAPETAFAVTYIEVAPAEVDAARRLLARYRDAVKASNPLELSVFEQIGRPNHFVIVERWPSDKARQGNAASTAARDFRAALAPLLIAPYDERPHFALSVGPIATAPAGLYVVTHVDVVPTKRDEAAALVKTLTEVSSGTTGNVRFDALVQASRPNHMTLVEAWTDAAAQAAHSATSASKSFRGALGPMSGSLYDERLYTSLK